MRYQNYRLPGSLDRIGGRRGEGLIWCAAPWKVVCLPGSDGRGRTNPASALVVLRADVARARRGWLNEILTGGLKS